MIVLDRDVSPLPSEGGQGFLNTFSIENYCFKVRFFTYLSYNIILYYYSSTAVVLSLLQYGFECHYINLTTLLFCKIANDKLTFLHSTQCIQSSVRLMFEDLYVVVQWI